jgi:hypothetical protein
MCVECQTAITFTHLQTCLHNPLGKTTIDNAIRYKNIATHAYVQIFLNSEHDYIKTLEFYEQLKEKVDELLQTGKYVIVQEGYTTLDHIREMKKQSEIKK